MNRSITATILITLSLAACTNTGGLGARDVARNAPYGADKNGQGVDGLLVGHRYLRAAGEQGINVDVLSAIGSANLQLGRLGQAEQILRRALEIDPTFVPAMNNLGVALMGEGKVGEARVVFQQAFAQDSGETDAIRENLRLAIAKSENEAYVEPEEEANYSLVRRGQGEYLLLSKL
jgi:tetratricopeptide (TPR) repeat protein